MPPVNSKKEKPVCPVVHHSDHIIPIIYGEPTDKTIKKAQEGLDHLAGCVTTQGAPKYYCTIHEKEF